MYDILSFKQHLDLIRAPPKSIGSPDNISWQGR
jgi:hypothetical protein